ncbi:MAG TPA: DUF6438 domain-containing protein [Steroidobacteraceae bacterium]|nr:DUF6438 domain-containing protein [Steroidobacteraceae bacterium]
MVATQWTDLTEDRRAPGWDFELMVDESGAVAAARMKSGAREYRDEAVRAAQAVRFHPFVRDGRPVAVRLNYTVRSRPIDYAGPAGRAFPATPAPSTTIIAINRTGCYGTCPSYRVELHGDGEVFYRGDSDVLVRGSHRWRVDPAKIAPLLELFRRANYFALGGYYEFPVSDLPTYTTRLSIGDQHKFVLNYGGSSFGGAFASTRMPGEVPDMPPVVTEIENAIDEISGAASYVRGDETTLQRLRAERWNFRSQDAGYGLWILLSNCKTALAHEFIRAGAPVNVIGDGFGAGLPVAFAARCADVDLVRAMIAKGALNRRSEAKSFLWSSVGSGYPGMVALALTRYRNVNSKDEDGTPLLTQAAGSYVSEGDPGVTTFDSARVVEILIDAGADPNARDEDGKTPIFEANDAAVAAALLRRGADPNARDNEGQTALFDHYFDEPKGALLAAGAEVDARDKLGRTALFCQDDPASIKVLLDGGANLNALDLEGLSAIEQMNSESGTSALLAAGAKLPSSPARLNAMIATATEKKWTGLLPLLEAAAAVK